MDKLMKLSAKYETMNMNNNNEYKYDSFGIFLIKIISREWAVS